MERINIRNVLATWHGGFVWAVRSALHFGLPRIGVAGLCSISLAMAAAPLWWVLQQQQEALGQLRMALASQQARESAHTENTARMASSSGPRTLDGRGRLNAFEKMLLPHEDIPVLVQDILQLAENQGLSVQRGDYRPQIDVTGNFLRYGMSLPIRGDASAINRFIQAALGAHPALIVESVRFKREMIASKDIEARVQWVVLTRLPADTVVGRLP